MIKIILVGGIGSGKSYLAKLFNYPIFDADLEVARIYKKDKNFFINLKKKLNDYSFSFPVKKSEIKKCILHKKNNLKYITKIIHPLIRKKLDSFIKKNKKSKIVILDIPLYLENKLNKKKDILIFLQSSKKDIFKRLVKRKNYDKILIDKFQKLQLPLEKKKKKCKYIYKNDFKKNTAKKYVMYILKDILK